MSDKLVSEITKLKVKIDSMRDQFSHLAELLERDHDLLVEMNQRVRELESWKARCDVIDCKSRLDAIENWIKKHEKQHDNSFDVKFTLFLIFLSAFLSAFFSYVFSHIH